MPPALPTLAKPVPDVLLATLHSVARHPVHAMRRHQAACQGSVDERGVSQSLEPCAQSVRRAAVGSNTHRVAVTAPVAAKALQGWPGRTPVPRTETMGSSCYRPGDRCLRQSCGPSDLPQRCCASHLLGDPLPPAQQPWRRLGRRHPYCPWPAAPAHAAPHASKCRCIPGPWQLHVSESPHGGCKFRCCRACPKPRGSAPLRAAWPRSRMPAVMPVAAQVLVPPLSTYHHVIDQ
mmetsp:Transcript_105351/g.339796  ORF Transcript_105351/g.339796 Transcript_105351/m.339796 type:complete len:234 (+) Transcript_105351:482-1183(+)